MSQAARGGLAHTCAGEGVQAPLAVSRRSLPRSPRLQGRLHVMSCDAPIARGNGEAPTDPVFDRSAGWSLQVVVAFPVPSATLSPKASPEISSSPSYVCLGKGPGWKHRAGHPSCSSLCRLHSVEWPSCTSVLGCTDEGPSSSSHHGDCQVYLRGFPNASTPVEWLAV